MNDPGPTPDPADDEAASALDTVAQALDALDADDLDRADSLADAAAAGSDPTAETDPDDGAPAVASGEGARVDDTSSATD